MKYVALLRGINVGGNNKVPMAALRDCLESLGFTNVTTYIQSGNVILDSAEDAAKTKELIETALPQHFKLDSQLIKVLLLTKSQLQAVIANKPAGFGEQPDTFHSDVIFLMDSITDDIMGVFNPRDGVDTVWLGDGVVYSQRLSAQRTKSRLNKIMSSPLYKSMTIRNWNTVTKLCNLMEEN